MTPPISPSIFSCKLPLLPVRLLVPFSPIFALTKRCSVCTSTRWHQRANACLDPAHLTERRAITRWTRGGRVSAAAANTTATRVRQPPSSRGGGGGGTAAAAGRQPGDGPDPRRSIVFGGGWAWPGPARLGPHIWVTDSIDPARRRSPRRGRRILAIMPAK